MGILPFNSSKRVGLRRVNGDINSGNSVAGSFSSVENVALPSPANDPLAARWWTASAGVTESGGFVTSWTDQIEGATLNITGSGTNDGITLTTDADFNDQPVLLFDRTKGSRLASIGHNVVNQYYASIVITKLTYTAATSFVYTEEVGGIASTRLYWTVSGPQWTRAGGALATTNYMTASGVIAHGCGFNDIEGLADPLSFYRANDWTTDVPGQSRLVGSSGIDSLCVGGAFNDGGFISGYISDILITQNQDWSEYAAYFNDKYGLSITY